MRVRMTACELESRMRPTRKSDREQVCMVLSPTLVSRTDEDQRWLVDAHAGFRCLQPCPREELRLHFAKWCGRETTTTA